MFDHLTHNITRPNILTMPNILSIMCVRWVYGWILSGLSKPIGWHLLYQMGCYTLLAQRNLRRLRPASQNGYLPPSADDSATATRFAWQSSQMHTKIILFYDCWLSSKNCYNIGRKRAQPVDGYSLTRLRRKWSRTCQVGRSFSFANSINQIGKCNEHNAKLNQICIRHHVHHLPYIRFGERITVGRFTGCAENRGFPRF